MELYLHFILDMARSPGFGSMATDSIRALNTRFRFASGTQYLKLASYYNSPDRSTKSTTPPVNGLCLLVSTRFQVLFHSPPGVLFTFPSRYCSLSVTKSYLALEGGPPDFMQDSSCPALLRIQIRSASFKIRGFYPLRPGFPTVFLYKAFSLPLSITPQIRKPAVWAPSISLAATLKIVFTFFSSGY